jgi:hypothetical protein
MRNYGEDHFGTDKPKIAIRLWLRIFLRYPAEVYGEMKSLLGWELSMGRPSGVGLEEALSRQAI